MQQFTVKQIGKVVQNGEEAFILVEPEYIPALQALEGFRHIDVLWWFHRCDNEMCRSMLEAPSPYQHSPSVMGIFATRSPMRPNPLALSVAEVTGIDQEGGRIYITYTDAEDGSPVLDIKPYTPSLDRVAEPEVPAWCGHWPKSIEESGEFDWESEFNF